jgi:hypothetical protein
MIQDKLNLNIDKTLLKLSKDHPSRPVNWRWLLALRVVDNNSLEILVDKEDKYLSIAIELASRIKQANSLQEYLAIKRDLPHAFRAWELYEEDSNAFSKEIEARILAREQILTIASRFNLEPQVVKTYEALFFNVLDRIENKSYISSIIYNTYLDDAFDTYKLWKHVAYFGSPEALEFIINKSPSEDLLNSADSLSNIDGISYAKQLLTVELLKNKTSDMDTFSNILGQFVEIAKLSKDLDVGDVNKDITERIHDVIKKINWTVGSRFVKLEELPNVSGLSILDCDTNNKESSIYGTGADNNRENSRET